MTAHPDNQFDNVQKRRTGLRRIFHATGYSFAGLRVAIRESAFRQEIFAALVMAPMAFWVGQTWTETAILLMAMFTVLIVELLNTAIERVVDRVGQEWHELSAQAKDLGSAAVLLSLVLCLAVWALALWHRLT